MSSDTVPVAPPPLKQIKAKPRVPKSDRYLFVCSEYSRAVERGDVEEPTVLEFINTRRQVTEEDPTPCPFRHIAIELSRVTGVDITHESVRRWHRSMEALAAQQQASTPAA